MPDNTNEALAIQAITEITEVINRINNDGRLKDDESRKIAQAAEILAKLMYESSSNAFIAIAEATDRFTKDCETLDAVGEGFYKLHDGLNPADEP